MAKQGILSRLLGAGKAGKATALAKGAPGKNIAPAKGAPGKNIAPAKGARGKDIAPADTAPGGAQAQKPGPPYPMTTERQALIDEALRVRAQVREDLGEERIKKLETIIKHKGGV